MALHEDKFEYICHLSNKRNPLYESPFVHVQFQYTTSTGTILTPVDQLRDLGITVSSDLPGHHTYDLVVIKRRRWQHGYLVSSTLAILVLC